LPHGKSAPTPRLHGDNSTARAVLPGGEFACESGADRSTTETASDFGYRFLGRVPDQRGERMASFANRVVLITGAGSGLGREVARLLAAEEAAVAAIDLQGGPLETLEAELKGKRVAWAVADVTDVGALR